MWPNPQVPADLVTFTEEIINGKLHFLCSVGGGILDKKYFFETLELSFASKLYLDSYIVFVVRAVC